MFFGHVSVAKEIECWTLYLVGGVATTSSVQGLNSGEVSVSHLNLKLICGGVWRNFDQNKHLYFDWAMAARK